MTKYVTFGANCTYTVKVDVLPNASESKIIDEGRRALDKADINIGDLENPEFEFLCIDK